MGKPALSDELPVGLASYQDNIYHGFRHPHSQKTFYSLIAERLSIDSNADLTSFSLPSPTTYKKKKKSALHTCSQKWPRLMRREQRTENSLSETVLTEGQGYDRGN